ncbi:MAG TPA: acyl-CoA dehydrogenase [Sphingomonas sp.]|jgi:pimeloyl-CoA dehydrogenase
MDFEPSEEQVMIADSVDQFGARHCPPGGRLHQLAAGAEASAARWREMAELGWLALGQAGGTAENDTFLMSLMQGFGRHLMIEPYVTRCILVPALLEASSAPALAELRAGIADGRVQAALALGEPAAGFDLSHVETIAAAGIGGYRLIGVKSHVEDGADAEWFVVPACVQGTQDIALFLVHRDAAGLTIDRFRSIDGHRHARLRLDGVAIGEDACIAPPGEGLSVLEAAVDRAIVAHLAEALGSMDAASAAALDYLKTRRQFGVAIGSFQVLQHRMVDIDTRCEEARSMVYYATARLRAPAPVRRAAISAAKARVAQCGLFVARQCIQLHGGVGVSAELIVSHHLKRQMMLDLAYGNAAWHRTRFSEASDLAA